jgi:hypothetical protein
MKVWLSLGLLGCLFSCTTNSSIPDARDLEKYRASAAALFKNERAALEQQRAVGSVTPDEYQRELADLEMRIDRRATEAAWTRHALAEAERKILGIPTPDAPQMIEAPQAGSTMGGTPTQGNYRRFNDQQMGATASGPMATEFFRGYSSGRNPTGTQQQQQ